MGLDHSVRLVLRAAEHAVGGELFVLKMPALRIADMAAVMIRRLAPECGRRPEAIRTVEIGAKPGEKLYEELLAEAEVPRAYEGDELIVYVGDEPDEETLLQRPYIREMQAVSQVYHSGEISLMTEAEIEQFLESLGILGAAAGAGAAA
jgi:FlaA1/EpsC-like NDP-sugar epimerase